MRSQHFGTGSNLGSHEDVINNAVFPAACRALVEDCPLPEGAVAAELSRTGRDAAQRRARAVTERRRHHFVERWLRGWWWWWGWGGKRLSPGNLDCYSPNRRWFRHVLGIDAPLQPATWLAYRANTAIARVGGMLEEKADAARLCAAGSRAFSDRAGCDDANVVAWYVDVRADDGCVPARQCC